MSDKRMRESDPEKKDDGGLIEYFQGCEEKWKHRCPGKWADLTMEIEPNVRECQVCNRKVYRCESPGQAIKLSARGECISILLPDVEVAVAEISVVESIEDEGESDEVLGNIATDSSEVKGWADV